MLEVFLTSSQTRFPESCFHHVCVVFPPRLAMYSLGGPQGSVFSPEYSCKTVDADSCGWFYASVIDWFP